MGFKCLNLPGSDPMHWLNLPGSDFVLKLMLSHRLAVLFGTLNYVLSSLTSVTL
jgi:hypothetical protein